MILYHYTSLETFFKIFNTKEEKITFWATNAYFMNDPKEIAYSFDIFIKSLQLYEEENDINEKKLSIFFLNTNFHNGLFEMTGTPFLISFSESCDDLSMWRFYGKNGNGVSIGIEKEYLLDGVIMVVVLNQMTQVIMKNLTYQLILLVIVKKQMLL